MNKMSVGFRKSLFGFNSDDVIAYIEQSHKKFSAKEKELNQKIDELDGTIANVNAQLEDLKVAKANVEAQLKEYTDKHDEIERLSQNIGKLYLVAQANAKSIMQNSAIRHASRRLRKGLPSQIRRQFGPQEAAFHGIRPRKEHQPRQFRRRRKRREGRGVLRGHRRFHGRIGLYRRLQHHLKRGYPRFHFSISNGNEKMSERMPGRHPLPSQSWV